MIVPARCSLNVVSLQGKFFVLAVVWSVEYSIFFVFVCEISSDYRCNWSSLKLVVDLVILQYMNNKVEIHKRMLGSNKPETLRELGTWPSGNSHVARDGGLEGESSMRRPPVCSYQGYFNIRKCQNRESEFNTWTIRPGSFRALPSHAFFLIIHLFPTMKLLNSPLNRKLFWIPNTCTQP